MIAVICADDRGGTFFNHRRQSRDRTVCARILEESAGRRLWIAPYSAPLFPGEAAVTVDGDFLAKAGSGEVCFVEGLPLLPWEARLEAVVVYRWNRVYPADRFLDLALPGPRWALRERTEFPGRSHQLIAKEVYVR